MSIKKQFVELIALLEANPNKKVSTLLPQLLELATSKGGGNTFHKDEAGNVVAIYCWYHKQWELVSDVPYGKKASSATGLNTMCKDGVSQWSKQQRTAKKANVDLLTKVGVGEVLPADIAAEQAKINKAKDAIVVVDGGEPGFHTLEEALKFYDTLEQL